MWLEATNEHARDVYAHLGFRMVEVLRILEGAVNSNGDHSLNGEGMNIYGMIYDI